MDYMNLEFVVLNYNSQDGMDNWVKKKLFEFIDNGLLNYYKTSEPQYFHMSHAKNVVARCATGDVICNIDADNFTGRNFALYLVENFETNDNIFMSTKKNNHLSDSFGRIAMRSTDFRMVNGYDEKMVDYGYEDMDLIFRLKTYGRKEIYFDQCYLTAVSHTNSERFANDYLPQQYKDVYLQHHTPEATSILILLKNNEFRKCTLVANHETRGAGTLPEILEGRWMEGKFKETSELLILCYKASFEKYKKKVRGNLKCLENGCAIYYQLTSVEFIRELVFKCSSITNNQHLLNRQRSGNLNVNQNGYGRATLTKNFTETIALI